ncbi:MAG: 3-deoxy-7-phosphoheptulonate synthase [Clostridiales bacterium]|nr:3-deoxy-7-phosphoheptulonate synthase [Clostridiales bacterium]
MFEIIKPIMSAEKVRELEPFPQELKDRKADAERQIADIITGKDKRKLFIVGPCSADNEDAVCDYACRLSRIAEKVKDKIYIVVRVYTNKPRTRGEGYKGMFHSPDPHKTVTDIQGGILALRKMHIRVIKESGLFAADEMLYPDNLDYISDVLGYIAVGARSAENQMHRLVASGIDVPVGVKNPMNGSLPVLLNSIYAVQIPNEFKYGNVQVKTYGNALAHAVLRGAVDVYGNNIPNYHYEDIMKLRDMYAEQGLKNPAAIIDTNHSNSGKRPFEQPRIIKEVLNNTHESDDFDSIVKGFLVESYIEDGNQPPNGGVYGRSITDGCLGIAKTEDLIYRAADRINA